MQLAKRKLDMLHDSLAYQSKKAKLTYGIDVSSHMHPAFLQVRRRPLLTFDWQTTNQFDMSGKCRCGT